MKQTTAEQVFFDSLDFEDSAGRLRFIKTACRGDTQLESEVEALLQANDRAEKVFPTEPRCGADTSLAESPGTIIGRYKLLEQIGEGGFGVVFLAEQEEPVRRQVALKVIKAGMDTKQVVARFEAERQALALMDHPNIAKVLDGGVTGAPVAAGVPPGGTGVPHSSALEIPQPRPGGKMPPSTSGGTPAATLSAGRPYFVMELVRGISITRFCEEQQLTVKERLELFIPVCQAIQHAHQKGVIHRDVKPSNVLVASGILPDVEHGVPPGGKSGGLADPVRNETDPRSRAKSGRRDAALYGGLEAHRYIPKVIDFGVAKAISQRLTEKTLFTNAAQMIGTPAYMSPEQAEMGNPDVDTRTDVYSLGILLYELLTGTTPFPEERLKKSSYAELQRIIREEEPKKPSTAVARRIELRVDRPANGRYSHPLNSQLKTLSTRLRGDLDWIVLKAIDKDRNRRYATPLELAADLQRHLANEPVGAAAPSVLYKVRKFAVRNRQTATAIFAVIASFVVGLVLMVWKTVEARRSNEVAEAVLRFMQEDLLGQADPYWNGAKGSGKHNLTLLEAVDRAIQGMGNRYEDQPLVEASVHHTVGRAYRKLWKMEEAKIHQQIALDLFEQHLGHENLKTLAAFQEMAQLMLEESNYGEAEALCREILHGQRKQLVPSDDRVLDTLLCLGNSQMWMDKYTEATATFREVRDLANRSSPPNHVKALQASGKLTFLNYLTGHQDERARMAREDLRLARSVLGTNHPITIRSAVQAVNTIMLVERNSWDADALARDTLPRLQQVFGPEHVGTVNLTSEMVLLDQQRGLNGLESQRNVWELCRQYHGPDYVNTLFMQNRLAVQLSGERHFKEGEDLMRDSLIRLFRVEGTETMESRRTMRWMSNMYLQQGRFEEAKTMRIDCMTATRRVMEPQVDWRQKRTSELAQLHARLGEWKHAAELYREFIPYTLDQFQYIAPALMASWMCGEKAEAIQLAEQALQRWDESTGNRSGSDTFSLALLVVMDSLPEKNRPEDLINSTLNRLNPPGRVVLEGFLALRRGLPRNAVDILSGDATSIPSEFRSLSDFVRVLALHGGGRREEAQARFAVADENYAKLLRRGDLGHNPWAHGTEWCIHAAVIAIRDQAALALSGEAAIPVINAAYLTHQRELWAPVASQLEQANNSARRREWVAANRLYHDIVSDEAFSWDDADGFHGRLTSKLAAVWHRNASFQEHEPLIRNWLNTPSLSNDTDLIDQLLWRDDLPQDINQSLFQLALAGREQGKKPGNNSELLRHRQLNFGMAAWRNGLDQEALHAFQEARQAYNLYVSGLAEVMAAAVYHRLNDVENANEHLIQAESVWTQLRVSWGEDWGNNWHRLALFELALNEAKREVDQAVNDDRASRSTE